MSNDSRIPVLVNNELTKVLFARVSLNKWKNLQTLRTQCPKPYWNLRELNLVIFFLPFFKVNLQAFCEKMGMGSWTIEHKYLCKKNWKGLKFNFKNKCCLGDALNLHWNWCTCRMYNSKRLEQKTITVKLHFPVGFVLLIDVDVNRGSPKYLY